MDDPKIKQLISEKTIINLILNLGRAVYYAPKEIYVIYALVSKHNNDVRIICYPFKKLTKYKNIDTSKHTHTVIILLLETNEKISVVDTLYPEEENEEYGKYNKNEKIDRLKLRIESSKMLDISMSKLEQFYKSNIEISINMETLYIELYKANNDTRQSRRLL